MALMLRRGRRRRPSRTTPHRHPAAKRRLGSAPPVRRDLRAASYPRQRTERAHDLRSFRNVGDACWCPASQHVGSLISAGSATSTTRRESAERESPSLPGVSGGVPLILIDFPRVGGREQPGPCCGEDAGATHRAQRLPTTSCNETQRRRRLTFTAPSSSLEGAVIRADGRTLSMGF
jgi:hypothetical protein